MPSCETISDSSLVATSRGRLLITAVSRRFSTGHRIARKCRGGVTGVQGCEVRLSAVQQRHDIFRRTSQGAPGLSSVRRARRRRGSDYVNR